MDNGKWRTNLKIDWNETFKLWYSDEQAKKKKTLVRSDNDTIFLVYYNKDKSLYINKQFMVFKSSRKLKHALRDAVRNGTIDAFTYRYGD